MCSRFLRTTVWIAALVTIGCEREQRQFTEPTSSAAPVNGVRLTPQQPGPQTPAIATDAPYAENAYAINEGKRLYSAYNCEGCHFGGGGGMGPPLMDDRWIYGSDPSNIFNTIVEGRPNGMPSFGSKIPRYQIWQLASYVRSLAGLVPPDVAPSRNDSMHPHEPESLRPTEHPKQ